MEQFAFRLRKIRKDKNLSMQKLANLSGVSSGNISEYENGNKIPGLKTIIDLCKALNISTDYFIFGIEITGLSEDEIRCLNSYRSLTERDKGKIDLFMEQLLSLQLKEEEGKLSS